MAIEPSESLALAAMAIVAGAVNVAAAEGDVNWTTGGTFGPLTTIGSDTVPRWPRSSVAVADTVWVPVGDSPRRIDTEAKWLSLSESPCERSRRGQWCRPG